MQALGVYIFAGGFSWGLQEAGFKILAHLEDGNFGVATTRLNFPDLPIYTEPRAWPVAEFKGQVDVVYGNPPCASWSIAGISPKRRDVDQWYKRDPRTSCVMKHFDLLGQLRPRAWVWESVARAWTAGRELVDQLTDQANDLGYAVSVVLLDGYDCGLPQRRQRMFFVAHDFKVHWQRPAEPGPRTVREAWALAKLPLCPLEVELPPPKKNGLLVINSTLPGEGLATAFNRLHEVYDESIRMKNRPGFIYKRLHFDRLANTMTGGAEHWHPSEPRQLSVSEAKALCGYPLEYQFQFPPRSISAHAQMAKAVLPPVARWLGKTLHQGLQQNQPAPAENRCYHWLKKRKGEGDGKVRRLSNDLRETREPLRAHDR
jgi:DNA (cytosine-5)-methyltransferase 1